MEDKNTNISRQNTEEKPSFECSNLQNKLSVKLEIGEELRRFYFEGQSFPELKVACLAYFNTADGLYLFFWGKFNSIDSPLALSESRVLPGFPCSLLLSSLFAFLAYLPSNSSHLEQFHFLI